jgi:hypothetical protein
MLQSRARGRNTLDPGPNPHPPSGRSPKIRPPPQY